MLVRISTLQPWDGRSPIDGITHQSNIEQLWSAEDLAAIDLAVPISFTTPVGKVETGAPSYVKNQDGTISEVYEVTDMPPPAGADVDAVRDLRIATMFTYQGHAIALDGASQLNITAMGAAARFAQIAGAAAGNLRWSDPSTDFGWICSDNSLLPLDAPSMAAMSSAAMAWVSGNTMAARAIKNLSPIPADYSAASRWPTASGAPQ